MIYLGITILILPDTFPGCRIFYTTQKSVGRRNIVQYCSDLYVYEYNIIPPKMGNWTEVEFILFKAFLGILIFPSYVPELKSQNFSKCFKLFEFSTYNLKG